MFKFKKSSPDKSVGSNKSASLSRNPSLKSTSNDTSTGTVTNEFGYFQGRLESLNQLYGDIQKIGTALDQSSYTAAQDKYKRLHDEIKKDHILKPEETKQLLFKIYEYQAISAFQAGKFQEHNEHLLHAYNKYGPDRDKSIIELERWVKRYQNLSKDAQTKVPSISSQCDKLLKEVETEVQSLIEAGKYDQACEKMKYLNENSNNFQIFKLYASTIKDPKEAFKYLKDKSNKYNPIQRQDIYEIFKTWQDKFNKDGDTKLAAEAASCAAKYNPNPSAAPVVSPEVKKIEQELKQAQNQVEKVSNKLETALTRAEHQEQIEKLEAKYKAKYKAELKAELEKANAVFNAKLETIKAKASPTKDTKVDEAGDFSTTSSLPPPYTSDMSNHPYLKIVDQNAPTIPTAPTVPTAPIVKTVTSLDSKVLAELTELAHSIPSLKRYDSKYDDAKGRAKSLLDKVVKENPDVYKTIEDPKILVLLADVLLSSNKMEEARIVCKKALDADPNIWQATDDQIVLLNLAGVLLSSSNKSEAKQIDSKAISIRIFSKDKQDKIDKDKTTMVSKTVAQGGYSDEERDCLAEVCLYSDKVYKQIQAVDCYPHADVDKRQEFAKKLQQLGNQVLNETYPINTITAVKAYMLYSKAFSVLNDDQELLPKLKLAYNTTWLGITYPTLHPYPPTEESTALLLGNVLDHDW
ncbi:MAG: hypothetical protein ACEY3C_04435 [Candidatus Tisiphia sp.]